MAIFMEINELRGAAEVVFDDRTRIKIRKKDLAYLDFQPGDDINPDDFERIVFEKQMAEGYEAALSILDFAAKTEKEIRRKLSDKGYIEITIDYVVERLKNARLLDDRQIAERIAEGAVRRGIGQYALKRKLRGRGIGDDDTEFACSLMDEEAETEGAKKEAARLYKKYASLEKREARSKLSQALARRGYSWDAVSEALEEIFSSFDFD